jgi:hypothetical protein
MDQDEKDVQVRLLSSHSICVMIRAALGLNAGFKVAVRGFCFTPQDPGNARCEATSAINSRDIDLWDLGVELAREELPPRTMQNLV